MFLLRRTATRALVAPSKAFFTQPRSITTFTPAALRKKQQQQCTAPYFQRRFASDDVITKTEEKEAEGFAQTATEAPVDENTTPAAQSQTVGIDALEAATDGRTERKSGMRIDPATPGKTLYIGNLYYEVTEDQLKRVFSRFGTIASVKVVYDNRGMSRGFAYIEYQEINEAQSAIDNLDMQVFEGRNLVVQFHKQKTNSDRGGSGAGGTGTVNPPSKTLFIGNMSFEMSDKDLNDLFRDIRNVMDVRVAIDRRTGQPRGFAHADFIDVASAVRAQSVLKEKVIYGRQLRIDFSKSAGQQTREGREPRGENA